MDGGTNGGMNGEMNGGMNDRNGSDSKVKLSQLRALVAIADSGNFSTAALQLELTQSTISHAIATLENELEVVLLIRGRHGATLTPIGAQMLQEARQILQLVQSIQEKAKLAKGLQNGQVRVATVRSIATHLLPKVIVRFRKKFPTIGVAVVEFDRYAEVEQALREGQVDVGFTSLPTSEEFQAWELFQDEFIALFPPGNKVSKAPTWAELTGYPMIFNLRSPQHNRTIREHLLKFGQTFRVDYEIKEDSTVLGMVQQGLGATIMARLAAEPIPAGVQIRSLPVPLNRTIGVAILAEALLPRTVFTFLDTVKLSD